jgi:adenylate cyclase
LRAEIIAPKIAGQKGRIVKTTGDGLLVEFAGVVDAVRLPLRLRRSVAWVYPVDGDAVATE